MKNKGDKLQFFKLSHRGLVRKNNEDHGEVVKIGSSAGKQAFLAVLADGVGGHNAGEIASKIAVEKIIAKITREYPVSDPHTLLGQALQSANQAILRDIEDHPERHGMGTTCICVLIIGRILYTAHLGDSRLYLHRKRKLYQLTQDHTLYEEILRQQNGLQSGNTRSHPMAHVLSRYLGSPRQIKMDHSIIGIETNQDTLNLRSGDTLLLCSDGITDLVKTDEIAQILSTCAGRKCAQRLVYRALEQGGSDNASVIVIKISA